VTIKIIRAAAALCCLLISGAAPNVGAANAKLDCTSAGKRPTRLGGEIPGDFAEFSLTLADAKGTVRMTDEADRIFVITAFERKVFTVAVGLGDQRNLLLYAIPATIAARSGEDRRLDATFDAVLVEAPKPGYTGPALGQSTIEDVRMKCSYHFST
jgi:hypothetical protein